MNFGSTSALGHGFKPSGSPPYDVAKAGVQRLTTTLAWLKVKENIRVNCIVPDWVDSEEVMAFVNSLTPEQRKANGVPAVITTREEIASAVVRLITDESLAGRVLVWWSEERPGFVPKGDRGYERLEFSGKPHKPQVSR